MKMFNKQTGITLIEMMIAMVIGLLVSGIIITIFISNVKSSSENIKMVHLNQELRTVMNFISDEVKRAGYSADPSSSAFIDELYPSNAVKNCILYAYDVDGNGLLGVDERFGFKLDGGAIKWTKNRTGASPVDDSACGLGTWTALTDDNATTITAFMIDPTPISVAIGTVKVHHIDVSITGQISLNPGTASRTINETIRVRNDDAG